MLGWLNREFSVSSDYGSNLLIFVEPPGADPHAVVVSQGFPEKGILTRFRRHFATSRATLLPGVPSPLRRKELAH
jgi:hypothetical protein